MALTLPKSYAQDVTQPIKVRNGGELVFTGNADVDTISVTLYNGGAEYEPGGSVTLNCIRADGVTMVVSGAVSGNVASATLTQACCAVPGMMTVVMQLTSGGTGAIFAAVYNVLPSSTDTVGDAGTIIEDVAALIADIDAAVATIPEGYSELSAQVAKNLYIHETDTDAFYWRPQVRVNSTGSGYATSQAHYTGLYKNSNQDVVYVYPGSTIMAKTGYTMDYTLRSEASGGTRLEWQRDVTAGTKITIQHAGYLRVSVTDGTSDTSTVEGAAQLAKAGLEIDLVYYPVKDVALQNKADIAELQAQVQAHESALERGEVYADYISGKSITTNVNVGATVDVNTLNDAPTFECAVVEVLAGDKYRLTGNALNQARLWAFTDNEYALISKSGSNAHETDMLLTAPADGYLIVNFVKASTHSLEKLVLYDDIADDVQTLKTKSEKNGSTCLSDLVTAQKEIAADWRFAYINISGGMGLGSNHLIPGTATTWDEEGTKDLDQKGVWMSDGVHPHLGTGVRAMYAQTIAPQLAVVSPDYRGDVGLTSPSVWAGRNILWMGTSIPAGRDPNTQNDDRDPYPKLVATMLGATCYNAAEGSSCVRINSSTGQYTGMKFVHFLRVLTRTLGECDDIIRHWDNYKVYYSTHETLTEDEKEALTVNSFENKLVPWLNGLDPNKPMPDLFVIDHGHNDTSPRGVDGLSDLWIEPTLEMIQSGILAEDTYMVANDYAHLKTALNNDLSGITDKAAFAASLNRNCFKGAMNFLVTVILTYNPYARVVIVGDYN